MWKDPSMSAQQPRIQWIPIPSHSTTAVQQMRWNATVRWHRAEFPGSRMTGEAMLGGMALCEGGCHLELGLEHVRTVGRRTESAETEVGWKGFRGVRWSSETLLGHHWQWADETWLRGAGG